MSSLTRMRTVLVALGAACVLTVGVTPAVAGGGNSANAKLCQKDGWKQWVRTDQTAFTNQGDCVSYGAHAGTLTSPELGF